MTSPDDPTPLTPPGPHPEPVTGKPNTGQMIVIHKALTREFDLLPAIVGAVAPGDRPRTQEIAAHTTLALSFLDAHHDGEDRLLWPLLVTRLPLAAALIETMERQHAVVADQVAAITSDLAQWSRAAAPEHRQALTTHLNDLHTTLDEHLRLEESDILPLVEGHLTVAEWNAPFEYAQHHTPVTPREGLLLVGMVLEDALADERTRFLDHLPGIARVAWRLAGARQYRRYVHSIRRDLASN